MRPEALNLAPGSGVRTPLGRARSTGSGRAAAPAIRAGFGQAIIGDRPGDLNETAYAMEVVTQWDINHASVRIDPGKLYALVEKLIFQCESPLLVSHGPWLIYQAMKQRQMKVSIEGHGGDELLAGYPHHVGEALQSSLAWPPDTRRILELSRIYQGLSESKNGGWRNLWNVACRAQRRRGR